MVIRVKSQDDLPKGLTSLGKYLKFNVKYFRLSQILILPGFLYYIIILFLQYLIEIPDWFLYLGIILIALWLIPLAIYVHEIANRKKMYLILDLFAQAFPNVDVTQGLTFYQKANAWFTGKGRTKEDKKQITRLSHARLLEAMGLMGIIFPIVTQNPKFEIRELQEKLQIVSSYYKEKAPPQMMREIFGLILIDLGKILA